MNRTLVEMVRSMLSDAKLPQRFWAEALSTAVYLSNRSPTKAVQGMTPFEAWTKEKPAVGHLRVFGSDAYAHVPKEERRKLDSKAKKCILVGYGEETKGYRLYDPTRAKIIFSRDVVFKENKCDRASEAIESQGECHIELELSSDEESLGSGSESESEPAESGIVQPQPFRRSTRTKQFPDYYGWNAHFVAKMEPSSVDEVMSSPEKDHWISAMKKEALEENDVWKLVKLPDGRKPVGSKWVF